MNAGLSENDAFRGKLALVTGATRGIGKAVALELAQRGAHVLALAKTKAALEELDDEIGAVGGTCALLHVNLTHADKVDALGPSLYQAFGRLDMLVSSAAVLGPLSPLNHINAKDWLGTFEMNVHVNWRLIRTLDPLLRAAPAARAVFLTSGASSRCRAYWGPYSASKAALEALVKTYANELATTQVKVNLFDPGPVATRMRAQAYPGEDQTKLTQPHQVAPQIMRLLGPDVPESGRTFSYGPEPPPAEPVAVAPQGQVR